MPHPNVRHRRFLTFAFLAVSACGGGATIIPRAEAGAPLSPTCQWFVGDNCRKQAIAALYACAPKTQGRFNATRTVCTLEDGTTVNFSEAVVPRKTGLDVDFTITRNGATCAHVDNVGWGEEIETNLGTYRVEYDSPSRDTRSYFCPDGTVTTMLDEEVLDCEISTLPTASCQDLETNYSFEIPTSFAGLGGPNLFNCKAP
jgi:hypothetical protein